MIDPQTFIHGSGNLLVLWIGRFLDSGERLR